MGDEAENNKMLAQINEDTEKRKQAIADSAKKVHETGIAAKEQFINAICQIN